VDGVTLDVNNYEAVSGSTVITLKSSYLETLNAGKHTLDVVYEVNGNEYAAACEFTIENASMNLNTGDTGNVNGWMTMMLASALGLFFFTKRKKEQEN
jgi:LPXTG-motif cell wall-anchored protein